jgi:HEAT repeat protein
MTRRRVRGWWLVVLLGLNGVCAASDGFPQQTTSATAQPSAPTSGAAAQSSDVDRLITQLQSPDVPARLNAAAELGKHPDAKATQALIDALPDSNEQVAQCVARALASIGAPAVRSLLAQLDNPDPRRREMAALALTGIPGQEADRGIENALQDPNRNVRSYAISGLGKTKNDRRLYMLVNVLTEDPSAVLAMDAENALGKIGKPAIPQLAAVLNSENQDGRSRAAIALGRTHDQGAIQPLVRALNDADTTVRRAAASALSELAAQEDVHAETAVEPLIGALQDADAQVRERAATALWRIRDIRAVEPLIKALQDSRPDVRAAAAGALGGIQDRRAVDPLIKALQDSTEEVRLRASIALGQIRDVRGVVPLIAVLKDGQADVRAAVATALGKCGDVQAVDPLIALLQDQDANVRGAAASALGQIGNLRAVEPLLEAFRKEAAPKKPEALQTDGLPAPGFLIGGPAIAEARRKLHVPEPVATNPSFAKDEAEIRVQESSMVRSREATALGQIGDPRAIPTLVEALKNPEDDVRVDAATALGHFNDPRVERALIAELPDYAAGLAAAESLRNSKDPRIAMTGLIALLGRDPYQMSMELADMGTPAVKPLIAALRNPDPKVRTGAVLALAMIQPPQAWQAMQRAIHDPDPQVSNMAKGSVGTLSPRAALADIQGSGKNAVEAVFTLSWIGPRGIPPLIRALQSPDTELRLRAAWVLSKSKDPRAAQALLEALRDSNMAAVAGGYVFFIQRGESGTEAALIAALNQFGDVGMVNSFRVCGNAQLAAAARQWKPEGPARGGGNLPVRWGRRDFPPPDPPYMPPMWRTPGYWAGW